MRNVLLYIDNTEALDLAIDRAVNQIPEGSKLSVVLQLSELSKEVIPLIGDLAELRAQKYLKLLDEWYKNQPTKFQFFTPVVLQSDFKEEEVRRLLHKEEVNKIYVFNELGIKMKSILHKSSNTYTIKVIQINYIEDSKAGE